MEIKFIISVVITVLLVGCRKDNKGCWQAFDKAGADVQGLVICNKTQAEAEAMHPEYWFYKSGETKFCWQVQTPSRTSYTWNVPQSMAEKMSEQSGYVFTKKDCNSFCSCEWYEKHKSKITGQYGPTLFIQEYLLSADTCNKLSVGRVVILRETTDSLITRELAKKNP
jgi:hypothetical protein